MASIDTTVAKEELGLKEFITWQKTLLDTVDSLLELEKKWAEAKWVVGADKHVLLY